MFTYYRSGRHPKGAKPTVVCIENSSTAVVRSNSSGRKHQHEDSKSKSKSNQVISCVTRFWLRPATNFYYLFSTTRKMSIMFFQNHIVATNIDSKEEEIIYLRQIVHKLNSELSRCQNIHNKDNHNKKDDILPNMSGK